MNETTPNDLNPVSMPSDSESGPETDSGIKMKESGKQDSPAADSDAGRKEISCESLSVGRKSPDPLRDPVLTAPAVSLEAGDRKGYCHDTTRPIAFEGITGHTDNFSDPFCQSDPTSVPESEAGSENTSSESETSESDDSSASDKKTPPAGLLIEQDAYHRIWNDRDMAFRRFFNLPDVFESFMIGRSYFTSEQLKDAVYLTADPHSVYTHGGIMHEQTRDSCQFIVKDHQILAKIGIEHESTDDSRNIMKNLGYLGTDFKGAYLESSTGSSSQKGTYPSGIIILYTGSNKKFSGKITVETIYEKDGAVLTPAFKEDFGTRNIYLTVIRLKSTTREEASRFNGDLFILMDYYAQINETGKYIPHDVPIKHFEETMHIMSAATGDKDFIKQYLKVKTNETEMEEMTMCEVIARIKNEARLEGLMEGKAEGKLEGLMEGKAEGKLEGLMEGKAEGKLEGLMEGKAEGKLEGKTETAAEFAELADFLVATHRENLLYKMNKNAAFRKQLSLELAHTRQQG